MSLTDSTMLPLGTFAPDFELIDVLSNQPINLKNAAEFKGTVIIFMCNHCPYVIHLIQSIALIAVNYQAKGFQFIGINSNDIEHYPEDSPEKMILFAKKYKLSFPYCYDESQVVAKSYQAACTPDFYVFNSQRNLVYRGRFDSSRPGNAIPPTGVDLLNALDCLIDNKPIPSVQYPSAGCNIKWK